MQTEISEFYPRPTASRWFSRILLTVVGVAIFLVGLGFYLGLRLHVGRDVSLAQSEIEGLPASATHISYAYSGMGPVKVYEFEAPEQDVVNWAKANGWVLRPIAEVRPEGHQVIYRFGHGSMNDADPREVDISDGLYLHEQIGAPDSNLAVAYDRATHRAYYYRSYR